MVLPDLTKHTVEKKLSAYCERRFPPHTRNQIKLTFKFRAYTVTLIKSRPSLRDPSVWTEHPVAQFRFDLDEKRWRLYCPDQNLRWHFYDVAAPTANLDDLLAEVDRDQTGIFWG